MATYFEATSAANSELEKTVVRIRILVASGLLLGLLLSYPLWLSTRSLPLVPLLSWITPLSAPFDYLILGLLLTSILMLALGWRISIFSALTVLLLIFELLQDRNRVHPWTFQYSLMIFGLLIYRIGKNRQSDYSAYISFCQLLLVCLYFWSGIQKLNWGFFTEVVPWLMGPLESRFPEIGSYLPAFGFAIPVLEACLALMLLTLSSRRFAVCGLISMHLFLLILLGPLGHNWNQSVWPWNVVMCFLLPTLFWSSKNSAKEILCGNAKAKHFIVLFLCGLMPGLGYFGFWDHYLSFGMYSGATSTVTIEFPATQRSALPQPMQRLLIDDPKTGRSKLDLTDWSIEELRSPPNPDLDNQKVLAQSLCHFGIETAAPKIIIHLPRRFRQDREIFELACSSSR